MTKFTPKHIDDNVNVAKVSIATEFFSLFFGLLVILIIGYFSLGIILNIMVDRMPDRLEFMLTKIMDRHEFETPPKYQLAESKLQSMLDDLVSHLPSSERTYTVHIQENEMANAFALHGGHIVILSGLLKDIDTQNELDMILAHELGHFANRDHMRGLSRGVVFILLYSALLGNTSGISDFVAGTLNSVDLKFSREQETASDEFALDLLNKRYGHVAGATDFFEKVSKKMSLPRYLEFMSSHPLGEQRIEKIQTLIKEKNYTIGDPIPIDPAIKYPN